MEMNNCTIEDSLTEKIQELSSFCIINKIPAVFIYAIEKEQKTATHSVVLTPAKLGIKLSEDRISPMVVLAGTDKFKIVPIRDTEIFDESAYYPVDAE